MVCEKDVRFQEQIQKHEEELMMVTAQSQDNNELQKVHIHSLIYCLLTINLRVRVDLCMAYV